MGVLVNRRFFLRRIGAAAIALTLARHLPGIAPKAFTLAPPAEIGLAVRFVRQFDDVQSVSRFDVFFGMHEIKPEWAMRVDDQSTWWARFMARFA